LTRQRRLGRGLEALLGRVAGNVNPPDPSPPGDRSEDQTWLEPGGVQPGAVEPGAVEPDPGSCGTPSEPVGQGGQGFGSDPAEVRDSSQDGGTASQETGISNGGIGPPENGTSCGVDGLQVDIERIDSNPFQPRQDFEETDLRSLADSLLEHGLLQPLVVRRVDDRYQLIAGERRLRAAGKAGWKQVPVQIVEADDRQVAELAIVENLQRKDLNPLEKAASFQRYLEQYGGTQEELAARLKLDRSTIANLIRLLELPEPVQEAIRQGKITQGHARALLPLGDEREQIDFCGRIQREGLSVRRTESLVQEAIQQAEAEPLSVLGRDGKSYRPRPVKSEHVAALEQEFRIALGTQVRIMHSGRGRGKLVIHFGSHEEFERLRQHLCELGVPSAENRTG
jgi:ParB family chromosome partitioning protein